MWYRCTAVSLSLYVRGRCDPLTIVYCLFRYRNNRTLAAALSEKISLSEHPEAPTYTLHLCYLMLIEPLATVIENMLLLKCKTSLHWALQVCR